MARGERKAREEAMIRRVVIAALGLALVWSAAVHAQSYPARPVKLVVTFAAGGAADLFGRAFASALGTELGQQVFVEVHAGAGGMTGIDYAAKSPPDGYTLCLAGAAALSAMPFMVSKMPFDWQKDLTLITDVVRVPEAVVVTPALGVDTLPAFIAYARAHPGKINFGSAGLGTITQMAAELLKEEAKIDIVHVPYRGVAPAMTDLLGNQLQMLVADVPFLLPHVKAGAIKALALTSAKRTAALPDLPTTGEVGYPRVNSDNWYGLVAPAGLPPDVREKVYRAAIAALKNTELNRQFATLNAVADPMTPQDFAAFIRAEQAKWGPVVAKTGVRLD
jgi:tripartite-type tricarboxylate transporter receptor subunit TctC